MHISEQELEALRAAASAMREEVEESAYTLDRVRTLHPAYRTNDLTSRLVRALALWGLRSAVRGTGLTITRAHHAFDLVWSEGSGLYRKYRPRKASLTRDGRYDILVGAGSGLLAVGEPSLLREEQWVIGYTVTAHDAIDRVFAAEVVGIRPGKVGRLVLGRVIELGGAVPPAPKGFVSDDESFLPGFEDEDADDSEEGVA